MVPCEGFQSRQIPMTTGREAMEDLGFRSMVKSSRSQALWLATLGFFGGFAGVSIFGPLVPKFKELLDLTPFAAGMLAAIPALTGSLLRIPFGAAVERFGGKRPFLILMLITNIGVVGLLVLLKTSYPDSMDGTYPLLLVLGALIGCGIATFSVGIGQVLYCCLLYTSPSPRDRTRSRMPSSA